MEYGIKVSKPGFDATTAATKDLFVDTSYPLLKIKQSGSGSLSVSDGGSDSDTITHNLGYKPRVMVYGQFYDINAAAKSTDYRRYSFSQEMSTYYTAFTYTVSTTNIVISGSFWDESANSDTFNYFYYIFYDEK